MSKLIANFGCNNNYAMKTNKEYPATHSMSTAWFAADEDGNVAIFEFNENGPVPLDLPETSIESIFIEDFAEYKEGELIPSVNFTDEQVDEMIGKYKEKIVNPTSVDVLSECIIKIDLSKEKKFLDIAKKDNEVVCLSRKLGYYYFCWCNDFPNEILETIEIVYKAHFHCNDVYNEETNEVEFEYFYPNVPYYIYAQPYWGEFPIKRLVIPKCPARVSQLPKNIQKNITVLPIKFHDADYMQIAEYKPCENSCDRNDAIISYEIFPSIKIKCKYFELPDANGNMFYYLGSSLLHPENDSESQGTFFPTIMFFVAPDFCKQYDKKMKMRKVIGSNYCTIPIFNYLSAKDNFLQKQVETNILFFNPYIIIIETGLEKKLKQIYTFTADHKIEICGQCFPYFLFWEMEQHRDEILEYSNKEYRGIKIPTKLTKDEIESLKH